MPCMVGASAPSVNFLAELVPSENVQIVRARAAQERAALAAGAACLAGLCRLCPTPFDALNGLKGALYKDEA